MADDLPRLLFADWLEEHGECERAEFIRCNILADRKTLRIDKLWRPELLLKFGKLWSGGIPVTTMLGVPFRRGFVSFIALPLKVFLESAADLFSKHPITDVDLTDRRPLSIGNGSGPYMWVPSNLEDILQADALRDAIYRPRPPSWGSDTDHHVPKCLLRNRNAEGTLKHRVFAREQSAMDELSQNCVNFGRASVGMPALTFG